LGRLLDGKSLSDDARRYLLIAILFFSAGGALAAGLMAVFSPPFAGQGVWFDIFIGMVFGVVIAVLGYFLAHAYLKRRFGTLEQVEKQLLHEVRSHEYMFEASLPGRRRQTAQLLDALDELSGRLNHLENQQVEFLSLVTHELRSPLASIIGYAELLSEPDLRCDDSFLDACQKAILNQGDRICSFIEDVQTAAHVEKEPPADGFAPFSLLELAECMVGEIAERSGRVIELTSSGPSDFTVLGIPLQMRVLISHLIDNALQYSPAGQPVCVHLQTGPGGQEVELSVSDHGMGIAEEDQGLLFLPFHRLRRAGMANTRGSGLGLYIVRKVAEHHQGSVGVQSRPGEGSTFVVKLPVQSDLIQENGGFC